MPVRIGVVTAVTLSPSAPLSEAGDSTAIGGTVGAIESMVRLRASAIGDTLPPGSVAVVVIECTPSARAGEVKLHVPPAETITLPSRVVPS